MELTFEDKEVLMVLAAEWEENGPPGYLESNEIANRLNLSVEKTKSLIHSLFVKGLVDTDTVEHFAAFLTPEGYDIARS